MAIDFPTKPLIEHHCSMQSLFTLRSCKKKSTRRHALKGFTGSAFFYDLQDDIIYVRKHIKLHPYQQMQHQIVYEIVSCLDAFHNYVKFELIMRQEKVKKRPNLSKEIFRQQYYQGQIEYVQKVILQFMYSQEWDARDPILVHTYGTLENYLSYLSRKIYRSPRQIRRPDPSKRASQEDSSPQLYPLSMTDHSLQHHLIPHVYQSE